MSISAKKSTDFLWENLKRLPYFRAFLRSIESKFYLDLEIDEPVLDLGCGDGVFAATTFSKKIQIGLDPSLKVLKEAKNENAYHTLMCVDGNAIPFSDEYFSAVVSNSVLEHIQGLDNVLKEINRVLKPGAKFIFCVPNHRFLKNLHIRNILIACKFEKFAQKYEAFFNKISRHYHAESEEMWKKRLNKAGFTINKYFHYFPSEFTRILEWGHYLGLHSLITKKIFGKWVLFPYHWNIFLRERFLRGYYEKNPMSDHGSYTFYIVQKQ